MEHEHQKDTILRDDDLTTQEVVVPVRLEEADPVIADPDVGDDDKPFGAVEPEAPPYAELPLEGDLPFPRPPRPAGSQSVDVTLENRPVDELFPPSTSGDITQTSVSTDSYFLDSQPLPRSGASMNVSRRSETLPYPIHRAVMAGNVDEVLQLTKDLAKLSEKDSEGRTVFALAVESNKHEVIKQWWFTAVKQGNVSVLQQILQDVPGFDIDIKDTHENYTALHYAAASGRVESVRFLLGSGANVSAKALSYVTPLHVAVEENKIEVIELLLSNGAELECKNAYGATALLAAIARGPDTGTTEAKIILAEIFVRNYELVNLLLNRGANIDATDANGNTLLHLAAAEGDIKIINLLLDKGANANILNKAGYDIVEAARKRRHERVANYLEGIIAGWYPPYPPLGWFEAAEQKGFAIRKIWQSYQQKWQQIFDIDVKDSENRTVLCLAAKANVLTNVRFLCEQGANIETRDFLNYTAIHYATLNGNEKILKILLSYYYKNTEQNIDTLVEVLLTEHRKYNAGQLNQLLRGYQSQEFKKNVDRVIAKALPSTYFPLHEAIISGDKTRVLELIQQNPDLLIQKDSNGSTPIHLAVLLGHVKLIPLLCTAPRSFSSLFEREATVPPTEVLIDQLDRFNRTPLMLAAMKGNEKMVKALIQAGANLSYKSESVGEAQMTHRTVLHYALASTRSLSIVKLLLQHKRVKALVAEKDIGLSLLFQAIKAKQYDAADLILKEKTDLSMFLSVFLSTFGPLEPVKIIQFIFEKIDKRKIEFLLGRKNTILLLNSNKALFSEFLKSILLKGDEKLFSILIGCAEVNILKETIISNDYFIDLVIDHLSFKSFLSFQAKMYDAMIDSSIEHSEKQSYKDIFIKLLIKTIINFHKKNDNINILMSLFNYLFILKDPYTSETLLLVDGEKNWIEKLGAYNWNHINNDGSGSKHFGQWLLTQLFKINNSEIISLIIDWLEVNDQDETGKTLLSYFDEWLAIHNDEQVFRKLKDHIGSNPASVMLLPFNILIKYLNTDTDGDFKIGSKTLVEWVAHYRDNKDLNEVQQERLVDAVLIHMKKQGDTPWLPIIFSSFPRQREQAFLILPVDAQALSPWQEKFNQKILLQYFVQHPDLNQQKREMLEQFLKAERVCLNPALVFYKSVSILTEAEQNRFARFIAGALSEDNTSVRTLIHESALEDDFVQVKTIADENSYYHAVLMHAIYDVLAGKITKDDLAWKNFIWPLVRKLNEKGFKINARIQNCSAIVKAMLAAFPVNHPNPDPALFIENCDWIRLQTTCAPLTIELVELPVVNNVVTRGSWYSYFRYMASQQESMRQLLNKLGDYDLPIDTQSLTNLDLFQLDENEKQLLRSKIDTDVLMVNRFLEKSIREIPSGVVTEDKHEAATSKLLEELLIRTFNKWWSKKTLLQGQTSTVLGYAPHWLNRNHNTEQQSMMPIDRSKVVFYEQTKGHIDARLMVRTSEQAVIARRVQAACDLQLDALANTQAQDSMEVDTGVGVSPPNTGAQSELVLSPPMLIDSTDESLPEAVRENPLSVNMTEVDLRQFPGHVNRANGAQQVVVKGDLHGNPLNMLHFLVYEGIVTLEENDYKTFAELYAAFDGMHVEASIEALTQTQLKSATIHLAKEGEKLRYRVLDINGIEYNGLLNISVGDDNEKLSLDDVLPIAAQIKREIDKTGYIPSDLATDEAYLQRFKQIIDNLTPGTDIHKFVVFIGDTLCDRGFNDTLQLWLFEKLDQLGANYQESLSNHNLGILELYFRVKATDDLFFNGTVVDDSDYRNIISYPRKITSENFSSRSLEMISNSGGQIRSLENIRKMGYQYFVKKIAPLIERVYLSPAHFRLLTYTWDEKNRRLILFPHAPCVIASVYEVARKFGINIKDARYQFSASNPKPLMYTIDAINAYALANKRQVIQMCIEEVRSNELKAEDPHKEYYHIESFPLCTLFWTRASSLHAQPNLTEYGRRFQPETYEVLYGVGHDGKPNVANYKGQLGLNADVGKPGIYKGSIGTLAAPYTFAAPIDLNAATAAIAEKSIFETVKDWFSSAKAPEAVSEQQATEAASERRVAKTKRSPENTQNKSAKRKPADDSQASSDDSQVLTSARASKKAKANAQDHEFLEQQRIKQEEEQRIKQEKERQLQEEIATTVKRLREQEAVTAKAKRAKRSALEETQAILTEPKEVSERKETPDISFSIARKPAELSTALPVAPETHHTNANSLLFVASQAHKLGDPAPASSSVKEVTVEVVRMEAQHKTAFFAHGGQQQEQMQAVARAARLHGEKLLAQYAEQATFVHVFCVEKPETYTDAALATWVTTLLTEKVIPLMSQAGWNRITHSPQINSMLNDMATEITAINSIWDRQFAIVKTIQQKTQVGLVPPQEIAEAISNCRLANHANESAPVRRIRN